MAIDVNALWDHSNAVLSEERFTEALEGASQDDQFILRTQIARTYGKRKDFEKAQSLLSEMEPVLANTSPEGQVRYWLELGRTHCSAAHPPAARTDEAKEKARHAYTSAFEVAKGARLDNLAIDALHMMTVVDEEPSDQLKWNREALAYLEASDQADAKKWEGSLRNNLGYALHLAGQFDEALVEFEKCRVIHEQKGSVDNERVARWMIAWTFRAMGRLQEALDMQLQLEKEFDAEGSTDPYVFEELEHIYNALGDSEKAALNKEKQASGA